MQPIKTYKQELKVKSSNSKLITPSLCFSVLAFSFNLFSASPFSIGLAIQNPAVSGSAGPATTPPSSRGGGLIRSPNPVELSGNLIVTGNVGGGRHFRGVGIFGGSFPITQFLISAVLSVQLRSIPFCGVRAAPVDSTITKVLSGLITRPPAR
jgi:hypothetical protein